jgi:hypothetical protein
VAVDLLMKGFFAPPKVFVGPFEPTPHFFEIQKFQNERFKTKISGDVSFY